MPKFIIACLMIFSVLSASAQKKLIHCGWDIPAPEFIKKNITIMEKAPYDGISISMEAKVTDRKGIIANRHTLWQNWRWKKEWFKDPIADLKAVKFKKFTDNFILLCTLPGEMSMFDDKAWDSVTHNIGLMAEIANECKLKGLIFDPEFYKRKIFKYSPLPGHSFADSLKMSRKRGSQVMAAMSSKYPDMTLLTFFMLGTVLDRLNENDLQTSLKESNYALFPAFIDGMLDAMPTTFKLIDGGEEAYTANSPKDFLQIYWKIKSQALQLIAPENQVKYKTQVQVGFGIWVDPYIAFMIDPNNNFHAFKSYKNLIAKNGMNQLQFLSTNIRSALNYSDKYVWDWCEYGRWWPIQLADWRMKRCLKTPMKGKLWYEVAPGITQAYELARLNKQNLNQYINGKKLKNLVKNPDFEEVNGQSNPGWIFWQTKQSKQNGGEVLSSDKGRNGSKCVELKNVMHGSMIQYFNVEPGDVIHVKAWSKGKGAKLGIYWKTARNHDCAKKYSRSMFFEKTGSDGWSKASGTVVVPENAAKLSLLLESRLTSSQDSILFDNIGLYKLNKTQ